MSNIVVLRTTNPINCPTCSQSIPFSCFVNVTKVLPGIYECKCGAQFILKIDQESLITYLAERN